MIGAGEESAALSSLSFYEKEDVELRVDLIPDLLDFNPRRIIAE